MTDIPANIAAETLPKPMGFPLEEVWVMCYCGCMGYGVHFPANQFGGPEKVCVIREYGLSELCVMRESTVITIHAPSEQKFV